MLAQVWQLWFFYANKPDEQFEVSKIRARMRNEKQKVEQQVQAALKTISTAGTTATILKQDGDWEGKPALWIRLDIAHALDFIPALKTSFMPCEQRLVRSPCTN